MELILSLMLIISAIICYALCRTIWREIMNESDCEESGSSSNLLSTSANPSQTRYIYTISQNKTTSVTRI
jgi:hypothetical protein